MGEKYTFDYFYGTEAEMFAFYRVPKLLVTSDYFRELSSDAKLLYGLMLDRMSLSIKNEWKDEQKRAFIYYSVEEIMESLNCGRNKAVKCLQELDSENGIGLIEKRRQGMGKSSIIYVKNFVMATEAGAKKFEKQTSRSPKSKLQEVCKKDSNYNNINNTYENYNKSNHIIPDQGDLMCDEIAAYNELIKTNIDYDALVQEYPFETETVQGLLELICEMVMCKANEITIASNVYPAELVKSKFLKLRYEHVSYVISCMLSNTTKVKNIKKYLLAALFNASSTMDSYYRAEVNHDMAQFANRNAG